MHVHPYHPGTTKRTGAPWSRVSGWPFISVARKALAVCSSSRENIQLAPGTELADVVSYSSNPEIITWVAWGFTLAFSRTEVNAMPPHRAALSIPNRAKPRLPAHSITWIPIGFVAFRRLSMVILEDSAT